jgi:hypothetical protein
MQRSNIQWLESSWPGVLFCAIFASVIVAASTSYINLETAIDAIQGAASWGRSTKPLRDHVLVVVADPGRRSQVILTLSPRGLDPVLATNLSEVKKQLAANPALPRLAVVDGAVRDSARIARTLAATMPPSRIVVLNQFSPREAIGKILLDRL